MVAWEKQAESCAKHLSKGSPVHVDARLKQERWETDGEKRSRLVVVAGHVTFLNGTKKAATDGTDNGDASGPAAPADAEEPAAEAEEQVTS